MRTASGFPLLSESTHTDVSCLTSVFGMGTGISSLLWQSSKLHNLYLYKVYSFITSMNLSRKEAREKIEDFFKSIKDKTPEEIKKIKKLASHHHIRLAEKRRLFCQKCYSTKLKTRKITKNKKTLECQNCGNLIRYNLVRTS